MRFAIAILFAAAQCWGATWYVAQTGLNLTNYGTNADYPWRTAYYAATNHQVQPGDTVMFSPGVYTNIAFFDNSGAPGSNITFKATTLHTVTNKCSWYIQAANIVIDGFEFTGGTAPPDYWYHDATPLEIHYTGVSNVWIQNCDFHDTPAGWSATLSGYQASPGASSVTISNNFFYDVGALNSGIIVVYGQNWLVVNNTISNAFGSDIFRPYGGNHTFRGNTVLEHGDNKIRVKGCTNDAFNGFYLFKELWDTTDWVHTNAAGYCWVDATATYAARGWSNRFNICNADGTTNYASSDTIISDWTMHDTNIGSAPTSCNGYNDHPDITQAFGNPTITNIVFERNWFQGTPPNGIAGYLCQFTCSNRVTRATQMTNWIFRNNVFAYLWSGSVDIRGVKFHNNVFYRCGNHSGSGASIISGGSYNPTNMSIEYQGEAYGIEVFNNAFIAGGWFHTNINPYGHSGYVGQDPPFVFAHDFNYTAADTTNWPAVITTTIAGQSNGVHGGNPGMWDVEALKFWLTNGSPLIDVGTNVTTDDRLGWSRPMGATNDIGAYEFDPNLLMHLDFSLDTTGKIQDRTGYQRHAWQMDGTNWIYTTNGPQGLTAGVWRYVADFETYHMSQYAAITNLGALQKITNGTISLWLQWDTNYVGEQPEPERGDTIMDAGDLITYAGSPANSTNSWRLAAYDPAVPPLGPFFQLWPTNDYFSATRILAYWNDQSARTSTNWWHIAAVWTGGTNCVAYENGQPFSTNDMAAPYLEVGGATVPWISLGALQHSGTPAWGDDAHPNAAWFKGKLADIRIYNRALAAEDVSLVYSMSGSAAASESEPEPEPPATNVTRRIGTLRVQTLRQR